MFKATKIMRTKKGLLFITAVFVIFMASLISAQTQKLFKDVSLQELKLSKDQNHILKSIGEDKTVIDSRIVMIETDLLIKNQIPLNLSPDTSLIVDRVKIITRKENDFTWIGRIPNTKSNVMLLVRDNHVTGSITINSDLYSIMPLGGGYHVIAKKDIKKFPPDEPPEFKDTLEIQREPFTRAYIDTAYLSNIYERGKVVIKVLVAYTPSVDAAVYDVGGLIQLAVDQTNESYENSNINITMKIGYIHRVDYTESSWFDTDLDRLIATNDGIMDDVHDIRRRCACDVVVLLINNSDYCGLAAAIMANADNAFALVYYPCAVDNYSFAHEIGHLQGARHNPEADSNIYPFPYGHGYLYIPDGWRTIMSYNSSSCPDGRCTRLQYWSNPDILYGGVPMGTEEVHNNARVLNETAETVASFMIEESEQLPFITLVDPPEVEIGQTVDIDIKGCNFTEDTEISFWAGRSQGIVSPIIGTRYDFCCPAIFINDFTFISSGYLKANITVDMSAETDGAHSRMVNIVNLRGGSVGTTYLMYQVKNCLRVVVPDVGEDMISFKIVE